MDTSEAELFVQHVRGLLPGVDDDAARRWVGQALRAIGAAWPELPAPGSDFAVHLATVVAETSWDGVEPTDLYLAWACARGDGSALEVFESRFGAMLDATAHGFGDRHGRTDDLRQLVRAHVLAPRDGQMPRIGAYRGTGPLEGWLRVAVTRRLVDETRRMQRSEREELRDDDWLERQCRADHVELDYLQARYRGAFRRAFATAAGKLSPEQRNYLRYQTLDGLTLDQIGAIHGQHRSSVDRRIRAARALLLEETRQALARELDAGPGEVDSVLRLIQSQMDASVSRLLRA